VMLRILWLNKTLCSKIEICNDIFLSHDCEMTVNWHVCDVYAVKLNAHA